MLWRRLKTLSRIADRRSHFVGSPSDLKEELMLLWLETTLLRWLSH